MERKANYSRNGRVAGLVPLPLNLLYKNYVNTWNLPKDDPSLFDFSKRLRHDIGFVTEIKITKSGDVKIADASLIPPPIQKAIPRPLPFLKWFPSLQLRTMPPPPSLVLSDPTTSTPDQASRLNGGNQSVGWFWGGFGMFCGHACSRRSPTVIPTSWDSTHLLSH